MHNEKIAEKLLAATRSPQDAYKYAIDRGKVIQHSRTMKTNPFGGQNSNNDKQEPIHYINPRGRNNYTNSQISHRGRSGFRGRPYTRGTQNTISQQSRTTNNNTQKQCYKPGSQFGPNHLQLCSENDKNCSEWGHFAKVSVCKRQLNGGPK